MKLIFVYNADSGPLNALLDSVHKIVRPDTYDCKLCALTYGIVSEDALWKAYREASPHELVFLHRDEFQKQFRSKWLPKYDFPVILEASANGLELLLSAQDLNEIPSSEALIERLNQLTDSH